MGRFGGMEENKKSASPKKNCAYGSLDSVVCIKGGMSLPVVTCHNLPQKKSQQGDGIPGLVLACVWTNGLILPTFGGGGF